VAKKSRASQRPSSRPGFADRAGAPGSPPAGQPATGGAAAIEPEARPASVARPTLPRTRPARTYRDNRSFFERHRLGILGIGVLAVVVAVSGFVFLQATQPLYGCSSIFNEPAAASPSGAPEPDRGKTHIQPGTFQQYDFCPPASGPHNTTSQFGPIEARYYGPDEQTVPQGWVHNLEHGALVVLYKCTGDVCGDATQNQLKQLFRSFPNSPVCNVRPGVVSPVITRFEQMPHPFAAIVWDRVMYLDTFDADRILAFYKQYGEKVNPEPQCSRSSPAPSGSPAASPEGSVDASASPSVAASPSPS
jgi:Protein of unknown function (DUF3105)